MIIVNVIIFVDLNSPLCFIPRQYLILHLPHQSHKNSMFQVHKRLNDLIIFAGVLLKDYFQSTAVHIILAHFPLNHIHPYWIYLLYKMEMHSLFFDTQHQIYLSQSIPIILHNHLLFYKALNIFFTFVHLVT